MKVVIVKLNTETTAWLAPLIVCPMKREKELVGNNKRFGEFTQKEQNKLHMYMHIFKRYNCCMIGPITVINVF